MKPFKNPQRNPEKGPFEGASSTKVEDYEIRILQALRRIMRAVGLHSRKLSFQYKVTGPQLVCLLFVSRNPGCSLSSVSKGIHLSPSTVVGILDRLELKGWTHRVRDTRDRRNVRIKVTQKGKSFLKKVPSPLQDRLAEVLKTLPELERATIALSLEKITKMMEAEDIDAAPILETGSVHSPNLQELPSNIIPITAEDERQNDFSPISSEDDYYLEKPNVDDAPRVEQLVRASPPLDPNSTYLYLILFEHFANTCVLARSQNQVMGFVTGYRLPENPEVLFIWQVGVHKDLRGRGLGRKMILEILNRPQSQGIRAIETTVNPSNTASRGMFEKFAKELGAPLAKKLIFPQTLFGKEKHEDEIMFHIGPLPTLPISTKELK